jgi:hypothetical protein
MSNPNHMTEAMRKVFRGASDRAFWTFSTGRYGWSENVAKAMERRGWARLVKRFTWDAKWQVTEAGKTAWTADQDFATKEST